MKLKIIKEESFTPRKLKIEFETREELEMLIAYFNVSTSDFNKRVQEGGSTLKAEYREGKDEGKDYGYNIWLELNELLGDNKKGEK